MASTFSPGDKVEWHTESEECDSLWVPATVIKLGRVIVSIDAMMQDGSSRTAHVLPEDLRHANGKA